MKMETLLPPGGDGRRVASSVGSTSEAFTGAACAQSVQRHRERAQARENYGLVSPDFCAHRCGGSRQAMAALWLIPKVAGPNPAPTMELAQRTRAVLEGRVRDRDRLCRLYRSETPQPIGSRFASALPGLCQSARSHPVGSRPGPLPRPAMALSVRPSDDPCGLNRPPGQLNLREPVCLGQSHRARHAPPRRPVRLGPRTAVPPHG
jgi:hypothetical protein